MSARILGQEPSRMQAWLPALLPLLAALALYRETVAGMVATWARSDTFMHAFLVPPIVLWLVWRQRDTVLAQPARPAAWVLLPMAGAALAWLLGELAAVNALTQAALVAWLVLTVPAVLGPAVARTLAFPLGFLFFAVPVGDFLVPLLMEWTADFTVAALRLSGIPVYRDGLQFVIPSGPWSVEAACSGIRYLMASLMTGVLFAYLSYRSLRRRLIFVALSIAVPVIANWVRAYLIVVLGHLSGNEIATGADHLVYGWVFFGVVIGLMFMIGARWTEPAPAPAAPGPGSAGVVPAAPGRAGAACTMAALAAVLMLLPQGLLWGIETLERGSGPLQLAGFGTPAAGWRPDAPPTVDWQPAFRHPSAEFRLGYAGRDGQVGLYVGYYQGQDRERKLVSSGNRLVDPDDPRWKQVFAGSQRLQLGDRVLDVRSARLRGSVQPGLDHEAPRLAVWQLYWVNGTLTASEVRAKAAGAFHRLLGHGDDAAVLLVFALQDEGREQALLEAFLHDNLSGLEAQLQRVRGARVTPAPLGEAL